jgi:hypothetical protein
MTGSIVVAARARALASIGSLAICSLLAGCSGEAGPEGPPGSPGAPGERGEMGAMGERGPMGEMGEMGERGDDGSPGGNPTISAIPEGDARCANGGVQIAFMGVTQVACNGEAGPAGEDGADGAPGTPGVDGADGAEGPPGPAFAGLTADNPAASCAAALTGGLTRSGPTWLTIDGVSVEIYCDQETDGGGWALLHNSVMGVDTMSFWHILYGDRLGRRGRPSLDSNFYDGRLYALAAELVDVFEDIRGKTVIATQGTISGFDDEHMQLTGVHTDGDVSLFTGHVTGGWSAPDHDSDLLPGGNCATTYNNVTQHYGGCWIYNLGSDGVGADGAVGPHVRNTVLTALGLTEDGTEYSRVRRISRFVRW